MPDACYYALIEREDDGGFVGWIPDLPGIVASGRTEDDALHGLSARARQCLHEMIMTGQPFPLARPVEELPAEPTTYRRLLLIFG
jgi:predicted RNase H-like HicB family nuclease